MPFAFRYLAEATVEDGSEAGRSRYARTSGVPGSGSTRSAASPNVVGNLGDVRRLGTSAQTFESLVIAGLDGEETEIELGGNETMKARAEWKGETLEIRANLGGGLSISRSYSLDRETGRLEVDISSNVRGRRIRRIDVYDRARR